MKAEFQFRHDQRALISEICIPFTLSRLRLDNSAAGVRHSSYFEIHRLVIGMMGAGSATIVSRGGGGRGRGGRSRIISEQRFDICLTFHIQKAGSIDGWFMVGSSIRGSIGFIAAYTPPLRYQPPPTSLIRPSNIYGKVSRIIESFDLINSSFDWFWCVLFREIGSIIRSFSTGLEILSRSQRSRTSDSREEYSTENWIFVEVCCDNFYQQRRKNTGTINLRVDRGGKCTRNFVP